MIIFALIWPATALRAAVSKTTWADAPAREFVFVENNSDDNTTSLLAGRWIPAPDRCQPLDRFKIQWFRNHLSAKPRLIDNGYNTGLYTNWKFDMWQWKIHQFHLFNWLTLHQLVRRV